MQDIFSGPVPFAQNQTDQKPDDSWRVAMSFGVCSIVAWQRRLFASSSPNLPRLLDIPKLVDTLQSEWQADSDGGRHDFEGAPPR